MMQFHLMLSRKRTIFLITRYFLWYSRSPSSIHFQDRLVICNVVWLLCWKIAPRNNGRHYPV